MPAASNRFPLSRERRVEVGPQWVTCRSLLVYLTGSASGSIPDPRTTSALPIPINRNLLTFRNCGAKKQFAASVAGAGTLFHNRIGITPAPIGFGWSRLAEKPTAPSPSPPRRRGPMAPPRLPFRWVPAFAGTAVENQIGFVPEIFLEIFWNQLFPTSEISRAHPISSCPDLIRASTSLLVAKPGL